MRRLSSVLICTMCLNAALAASAMAATTKLSVLTISFGSNTKEVMDKVVKNYEKTHPGIQVKYTILGWPGENGWLEKLATLGASGVLPDIVYNRSALLPYFTSGNAPLLQSLDEYIKSSKTDLNQWYKGSIDDCKYKGKQWALPYFSEVSWMFYNKNAVANAGVADLEATYAAGRWNMDTMASVAAKTTTWTSNGKVNQAGLSLPLQPYQYQGWAWGFGGQMWDEDTNRCTADSENTLSSLKFIYDLVYSKKSLFAVDMAGMPSISWDNIVAGKFAMHGWLDGFIGVWDGAKTKFQFNMIPFPQGPKSDQNVLLSTEMLCLTRASKNKKQAYDLLKYLTGDEGIAPFVVELSRSSTKKTMSRLWQQQQVDKGRTGAKYTGAALERLRPFPKVSRYSMALDAFMPYWTKALTGRADLTSSMQAGAKEANRVLSRVK